MNRAAKIILINLIVISILASPVSSQTAEVDEADYIFVDIANVNFTTEDSLGLSGDDLFYMDPRINLTVSGNVAILPIAIRPGTTIISYEIVNVTTTRNDKISWNDNGIKSFEDLEYIEIEIIKLDGDFFEEKSTPRKSIVLSVFLTTITMILVLLTYRLWIKFDQ